MNVKNTYFGFTDNLTPLQKGKAEKMLDRLGRYSGVVMTEKEFIYNQLKQGSIPTIKHDYTYYSKKLDAMTKPKDDYRITNPVDESFYQVSKTSYNYACYLLDHNLINEQKAIEFIANEQEKIQQQEEEKKRLQAEEMAKREEEKRQEEQFNTWLQAQQDQYNDMNKLNLVREIFTSELCQFNEQYGKRILVLIENIDNPKCKERLKEILHNGNTTSKKVFYHVTGIKLPGTDKGTMPILDSITSSDYLNVLQYKKKEKGNNSRVATEVFYKMINKPEPHFEEVIAEPLNKYGLEMFISKSEIGGYIVSEARSGLVMARGETKGKLLDNLKAAIDKHGIGKINSLIDNAIRKYGISPKYKEVITA